MPNINDVREVLDQLKDYGFSSQDIAQQLELHQVRSNARSVRRWYAGTTNIRNVEYRALRDFLQEVEQ